MRRRERKRGRWKTETQGGGSVNLISMMDILTVLLLFLLKSYVSGDIMVPPAGVTLPSSSADAPPASSLVVAIDGDEILVGNERVASLAEAVASESMEIAALTERLQVFRGQQMEISKLRGETESKPGTVTIQGDKDIEFRALQKVMYTLNANGYQDVALAVIQES